MSLSLFLDWTYISTENPGNYCLNSSLFYVYVGDTEPYPQSAQWSAGSITSIEAVSVPEPSALVVSAMLGIAAMVYRRCHNS